MSKNNNKAPKPKKQPKSRGVPKAPQVLNRGNYLDAMKPQNGITERLTPDGANWVKTALDPFHDYQYMPEGFPDLDGSHTTVSVLTYKLTLTAPAGGNPYDAHVFFLPIGQVQQYQGFSTVANADPSIEQLGTLGAGVPRLFGPINTIASNVGGSLFPDALNWNPAGLTTQALTVNTDLVAGYSRVIAGGIEVINTSPELYRSGSLTAYQMASHPTADVNNLFDLTAGNLLSGTVPTTRIRAPPSNEADASKLPGSCTWDAALGCYMPLKLSDSENPLRTLAHDQPMFWNADNMGSNFIVGEYVRGAAAQVPPVLYRQKIMPYDICGVFLTGLHNSSTFTIVFKVFVETAPSINDLRLPMSTPSAAYDPAALQLYDLVGRQMPIATHVGNNANGDWFRTILKVINAVARPFTKFFGGDKMRSDIYKTADNVVRYVGGAFPIIP